MCVRLLPRYFASSSALASSLLFFSPCLVLIVAYLPFSSPLSLTRWYLAQGCTTVHCDSTARDLRGRGSRSMYYFTNSRDGTELSITRFVVDHSVLLPSSGFLFFNCRSNLFLESIVCPTCLTRRYEIKKTVTIQISKRK